MGSTNRCFVFIGSHGHSLISVALAPLAHCMDTWVGGWNEKVLRSDAKNLEAYPIRALSFMFTGDFDTALKLCKECIRMDPDHVDSKVVYRRVKTTRDTVQRARAAADRCVPIVLNNRTHSIQRPYP